jgi:transcriptional regulator with GAF, ATPase, and Fis domain
VGDDVTRRVDARVIAATNRDLPTEVAENRFRLDLYYRLSVFPISVPPLRTRRDDIPDLIEHFVRQCCARLHVETPKLPLREITRAQEYNWPGNIRELQNVVERAVILARGASMELRLPDVTPHNMAPTLTDEFAGEEVVPERRWRELERKNVLRALARAHYRLYGTGGAAALLGINAATLASRLKKLGIQPSEYRKRLQ